MGKTKPPSIVLAPPRPTHAPSCWQRQGQASRTILIDASAESIAGRAGSNGERVGSFGAQDRRARVSFACLLPWPGSAAATHDPRGKTPGATIRAWAREQALPRFLQTDVIPLNRRFLRQLSSWVFYARANILVKSHHSLLRLDTPLGMVSGQNCDCKNMSMFTLTLGAPLPSFPCHPFILLTSHSPPPHLHHPLFCTPTLSPGTRA
jgi:hypothetical protein